MTIHLRTSTVRGAPAGSYRPDTMPLDRWPETPRYCASCGCRLRLKNRARICDPCELSTRLAYDKRQAWLHARGLLP